MAYVHTQMAGSTTTRICRSARRVLFQATCNLWPLSEAAVADATVEAEVVVLLKMLPTTALVSLFAFS